MQRRLLQEVYQECKLSPSQISYVETHGTGTIVGDPVEVSAIVDVFCSNREEPLWIGSVKSNIGHTEPVSERGIFCCSYGAILCRLTIVMDAWETEDQFKLEAIPAMDTKGKAVETGVRV
ncbi:fatty acid synthase [Trichonephila clavipes]|nr:fatty acid synthase [Trichonephila clavipes]